jgi:AraC family transcriptional regulator of adaptative response/methylated-DNA-[protein]-cysteine methyltransferase
MLSKAKSYLEERRGERVTLAELARAVGSSPFHLQRSFKRTFGLSPRGYQQALRVEAVKASLKSGQRVADAVFEAGYGSVSRFYEKAASRLGMAAREYRAKGKGRRIVFGCFRCSLGVVLVAASERGLCSVKLGDEAAALKRLLRGELSEAQLIDDSRQVAPYRDAILAFLDGEANLAKLPLDVRGTVFQHRVWEALRRIPRGETRTYRQLAAEIGAPAAVRAVGSACGANPVALAVPCHRAVRTDGGLGGYAWGLARKQKLLELEKPKRR